ncbi:MAG: hypothetical protein RL653_188 [Pseudomonadota bacterium]
MRIRPLLVLSAAALLLAGCKTEPAPAPAGAPPAPAAQAAGKKVGLVIDVGGRGDHSFNDSALRGLETWAAGKAFTANRYGPLQPGALEASLPPELRARTPAIQPVAVEPVVLSSKAQEDYEPNLQLLVDQGAELIIATGFMLENATETVARRNPRARFLLIDSTLLDPSGAPVKLPNVRTVVFREEEGSFLAGALAGLVSTSGTVGFVGGMEIPLVKKFEVGFRAGLATTNPDAKALVAYTGNFDDVAAGKQVGADLLAKGADVVFHAAGSDGVGVIQAVKEARAAGKQAWAIGVDSDQHHLAPDAVLTSMVKRVDLAVYEAAKSTAEGTFAAEDTALGLAQQGVGLAEVRVEFPKKAEALAKVEALRQRIVSGALKIPATPEALQAFKAEP